jgi:hypothetical protein
MDVTTLKKCLARNKFSSTASLHFMLIETAYLEMVGIKRSPVVPTHLLSQKPKEPHHD